MTTDKTPKFLYATRNRPPGFATVPRNWPWDFAEVPPSLVAQRPELPMTTKHRYGVLVSEVQLTREQLEAYEIEWLNSEGPLVYGKDFAGVCWISKDGSLQHYLTFEDMCRAHPYHAPKLVSFSELCRLAAEQSATK